MKSCVRMLVAAAIAVTSFSVADAAVIIVGVNGSLSVSGDTSTVEGSAFTSGPLERWSNVGTGADGTDFVGTFGGTSANNSDWYLRGTGFNYTVGAEDNYLEIFYSLGSSVSGSSHRLAFNGDSPSDTISSATSAMIPTTAGSHSFVIDVNQLDDIDPGDIVNSLRWDPWNSNFAQNQGTVFTLDRLVFGTQVTAVPEPSSLAFLAVAGVGIVARFRKRAA